MMKDRFFNFTQWMNETVSSMKKVLADKAQSSRVSDEVYFNDEYADDLPLTINRVPKNVSRQSGIDTGEVLHPLSSR